MKLTYTKDDLPEIRENAIPAGEYSETAEVRGRKITVHATKHVGAIIGGVCITDMSGEKPDRYWNWDISTIGGETLETEVRSELLSACVDVMAHADAGVEPGPDNGYLGMMRENGVYTAEFDA